MSENNDTSSESNSLGESIQPVSRLAASGGAVLRTGGVLRPSVLGPSVLGSALNSSSAVNNTPFAAIDASYANKTKEEMANNPFMKDEKEDEEQAETETGDAGGCEPTKNKITTTTQDNGTDEKPRSDDDEEPDERPDPLTLLRKNGLERANMFAAAKNSIPRVEKSGFVFGQNVHERVVVENKTSDSASKMEGSDTSANTSGDLLFSNVIENAAKTAEAEGAAGGAVKETELKSLTEVAREYEESRAQKRKYEEVETFTGEENEMNIVDINCKLFAFINSNWEERGRGSLRVNDSKNEQECSRVVFRTSGNLRLLLNTKIWAGMVAERSSQKSLRLTAMDNSGQIKIFLAMARPVDINQLYKALSERIKLRKESHPEECRIDADDKHIKEAKNGAATAACEVEQAAAAAVPHENDDGAPEPSPKKSQLTDTDN